MSNLILFVKKYWREVIIGIMFLSLQAQISEVKQVADYAYDSAADAADYARSAYIYAEEAASYSSEAVGYASEAADNASYCAYLY